MAKVIFVFPLPGGPSKTKIVFEAKEIKIASAISIVELVHIISLSFSLLYPLLILMQFHCILILQINLN